MKFLLKQFKFSSKFVSSFNIKLFVKLGLIKVCSSQVRNGRSDCEDGSDECQMLGNEKNSYFFNSKTKLIGNQMLYFFVWVMALLALTGNSVRIKKLYSFTFYSNNFLYLSSVSLVYCNADLYRLFKQMHLWS